MSLQSSTNFCNWMIEQMVTFKCASVPFGLLRHREPGWPLWEPGAWLVLLGTRLALPGARLAPLGARLAPLGARSPAGPSGSPAGPSGSPAGPSGSPAGPGGVRDLFCSLTSKSLSVRLTVAVCAKHLLCYCHSEAGLLGERRWLDADKG